MFILSLHSVSEDDAYLLHEKFLCQLISLVNTSSGSDNSNAPGLAPKLLEQPMFTVGKAGVLVNMLPTALRFWSKMGLTPRSGPKNVTAFVLYEDDSRPLVEVEKWINRISYIYGVRL